MTETNRFFKWLNRLNSLLLFLILVPVGVGVIGLLIYRFTSSGT